MINKDALKQALVDTGIVILIIAAAYCLIGLISWLSKGNIIHAVLLTISISLVLGFIFLYFSYKDD